MSYLTHEEFQKYLQGMREIYELTVDTEGTLNHPFSETWGLSTSAYGVAQYFAFNHGYGENLPKEWLPEIAEVIENHPCLIFHHAKHDLRALRNLGINFNNKFKCTMMRAHMVNENRYSEQLSPLSLSYGGQPKKMPEVMKAIVDGFGYSYVPVDLWLDYATNDAFITEELDYKIDEEWDFDDELWDWEQKFTRFLIKMEDRGNLIDQDLCQHELERGTRIMEELKASLGFNPGSPKELSHFLLDELNLPVLKRSKKTNKPSFDKEVMKVYDELLSQMNDNRAKQVLAYRGWSKTTGSNYRPYLERLGPDGRLRTNYKQHGTHTGRLSASLLHQIPKMSEKDWNGNLKQAFLVDFGRTAWSADFSQLELRLASIYAQEQRLLDIFNTEPPRDVFAEMSKDLSRVRDEVKTLAYTMLFGGGADRISHVFGMSHMAAKAVLTGFYKQYPGLKRIQELCKMRRRENGEIKYWTGRKRHLPHHDDENLAFSSLIQGGAFEIVKRASVKIDEAGLNNEECAVDLQVHDELRFDIENGKEHIYLPEIKRVMEDVQHPLLQKVKFRVDIKRWGEK